MQVQARANGGNSAAVRSCTLLDLNRVCTSFQIREIRQIIDDVVEYVTTMHQNTLMDLTMRLAVNLIPKGSYSLYNISLGLSLIHI